MTVFFAPGRIKKLAMVKGLSVKELAEQAGVSMHTAYRILQGRGVSPASAVRVARALENAPNIVAEELLADEASA